jgi:hypothetical protein
VMSERRGGITVWGRELGRRCWGSPFFKGGVGVGRRLDAEGGESEGGPSVAGERLGNRRARAVVLPRDSGGRRGPGDAVRRG